MRVIFRKSFATKVQVKNKSMSLCIRMRMNGFLLWKSKVFFPLEMRNEIKEKKKNQLPIFIYTCISVQRMSEHGFKYNEPTEMKNMLLQSK